MRLKFSKMQGIGNDFVVFDAINQQVKLTHAQYRRIADRHFGVGCDQILLVESPPEFGVDFRYRIFNADGSEVEQCGNGARCFARFVRDKQLTDKDRIVVSTKSGVIVLELTENGQVSVNMGLPHFAPADIPLSLVGKSAQQSARHYTVLVDGESLQIGAVSMGNPHAVLLVDDIDRAPVNTLGKKLESHDFFPERANVGFMQIVSENKIKLRVYERGVGETLACGTGACAAVVVGGIWGKLASKVEVVLPGGKLCVDWPGEGRPVMMTGPAAFVFDGEITL